MAVLVLDKAATGSCDVASSGGIRPTSMNVYSNPFRSCLHDCGVQAGAPLYTSTGTIDGGRSPTLPLWRRQSLSA